MSGWCAIRQPPRRECPILRRIDFSDVHYIFKRKPLPIRIDLPTQNEEGDSMLEEIPYDEASGQEVPDGEVLRSRVQQALREIDGK